jgi:unsaturated rhamnogalacturonyl hydrolase
MGQAHRVAVACFDLSGKIHQMKFCTRSILFALAVGAVSCRDPAGPSSGPASLPREVSEKKAISAGVPAEASITHTLTQVRTQLDSRMILHMEVPASNPSRDLSFEAGFESMGYPGGVTYAGMLAAADATGDKAFSDFVARRFQFFADTMPQAAMSTGKNPYAHWVSPRSLDDCGAMGAAMVKARRAGVGPDLKVLTDRFADYVSHKQFRLDDGALARSRPFPKSIWADDMYMSVPLLSQMGALTHDPAYYDDAATQVMQIASHLFVQSSGLYTHGWHETIGDDQPHYYWGRANGWCAMATVELLSVLPTDHPRRAEIIKLLKAHAQGVASQQSGVGLWHQLLDRTDSPLETSASAMFTFAIARAVNRGWLDAGTYGPVAITGWDGVKSKISPDGKVTGTCIGTSYADDYPYYYNRTFTDDVHGYGPVLLAGSEIIKLLNNPHLQITSKAGLIEVHQK